MWILGYKSLLFARKHVNEKRNHQFFHLVILAFILAEYGLWLSSCFWNEVSLSNPYYWFDFLITTIFLAFIPALKKAVSI